MRRLHFGFGFGFKSQTCHHGVAFESSCVDRDGSFEAVSVKSWFNAVRSLIVEGRTRELMFFVSRGVVRVWGATLWGSIEHKLRAAVD